MVASTDIKYFQFDNFNAPQLINDFGSIIRVLDACLINGLTLPQIASLSVNEGIATLVFNTSHQLHQYQVIEISGANEHDFNKQHRILTVSSNSLTFAITTNFSQATGILSAKMPSLDWEKPFSSTSATGGKAAYRSKNLLLSSRPYLRVVDELDLAYTSTYAKYAKVGIVEDMSDINTMLGIQAPYDNLAQGKNWIGSGSGATAINGWAKWYYAGAAQSNFTDSAIPANGNRSWILVGNSDYFYILPTFITSTNFAVAYGFGSFKSLLNADLSNSFLSATVNSASASASYDHAVSSGLTNTSSAAKLLILRNYSQSAAYKESSMLSLNPATSVIYSGYSDYIGAYSLSNIAPLIPVFINEIVLRGEIPNLYWLLQNKPYSNYQTFESNSSAFIATNIAMGNGPTGQIVLKVGDL